MIIILEVVGYHSIDYTIKIGLGREGEILESDTIVDREGIVVVLDALGMKRGFIRILCR